MQEAVKEGAAAMREMKEVWKEMKQRGSEHEDAPLTGGAKNSGKTGTAASGASGGRKGSVDEDDYFDTGFTLREITPQSVNLWLVFQIVSLLFQLLLWSEVAGHLSEFEEVISHQCAPEHRRHGVCMGPKWNVSAWQDVVLGGTAWSMRDHSWQFSTKSSPPTFLVVVDPVTKAQTSDGSDPAPAPEDLGEQGKDLRDVRWSLEVRRTDPPHVGPTMSRFHSGADAVSFEDLSTEARGALATKGRVTWTATLSARTLGTKKTRFVAFVEDAATPHLADIHASPQCAFGRSWKAFNMQNQGHRHKALSWCRFLLGIFIFVGGAAVYAVHQELAARQPHDQNRKRFHLVVLAKFVLQDVPQQVCIVLYLFGWYEAYGLRCQLCLFDPKYCSAEDAFHIVNLIALTCTVLSSVSNQLLIRPAFKKTYTEDDICFQYVIRVGGVCLAVLPLTTGLCWASRSLIPMPLLTHLLCVVPAGIGWLTLGGVACVPVIFCCDDDCDL
mmetsp:Transcript_11632/g.37120  ORF Transcript_11632/g.37120 Transcript_11632/m.37120 type:complete len:498 (-) Transcript_11632:207-1700(-)